MHLDPQPLLRTGAFAVFDWGPLKDDIVDSDEYTVDWVTARMDDRPRGTPLFLAAGIRRPHLPFFAPERFFATYPVDRVAQPPMPKGDLDDVPPIGITFAHKERNNWAGYLFGEEMPPLPEAVEPPAPFPPDDDSTSLKSMTRAYQAAASYADAGVGRLLDKRDATGRADDTIIVLWSDNGYHLGDKESVVKFTLWEKANHVPFIIVAPGVTKPGGRIDAPVNLVNIYPTLLELTSLPTKPGPEVRPAGHVEKPATLYPAEGNWIPIARDELKQRAERKSGADKRPDKEKWRRATQQTGSNSPSTNRQDMKEPTMKHTFLLLTALLLAPLAALHAGETIAASTPVKRPAFHFTPPKGWMNDPNGLLHHDGQFHLCYQSFPDDVQRVIYSSEAGDRAGARISWGHAVSRDLVHWRHMPLAIHEERSNDGLAAIYSGSAVVDHENRSGFGRGDRLAIVAFYTLMQFSRNASSGEEWYPTTQPIGMACSTDNGSTFAKYEGNPIVDVGDRKFGDPKVFWHEPSKQWIMVNIRGYKQGKVGFWSDAIKGGGTDDTALIQSILDRAPELGSLKLIVGGAILVNGLKVHSNTTIECLNRGCGFFLAAGANQPLIRNATPQPSGRADHNLSFVGGTYNGNAANQEHSSREFGWITAFSLHGVEQSLFRDVSITSSRTFAVYLTNWRRVAFENIYINLDHVPTRSNQDGIRLQGPGEFLSIRNIQGRAWDDMIALNVDDLRGDWNSDGQFVRVDDGLFGPQASVGPVADVVADGLEHVLDHQAGIIETLDTDRMSVPAAVKAIHQAGEAKITNVRRAPSN
ncbi:MAG TPA: sulfatase-like hydrolase/transferase [Thermoguttaceae bacterium]|nr:sulfatase-like hydrolase/transferase [Thermoguttaceae bacterium]